MKFDGDLDVLFERFDEFVSVVGSKKTCHVFNTDRVSAAFFHIFRKINERLGIMNRADGVRECRLNVTAFFDCCFNSGIKVSGVVESVKNSDDIDTVSKRFLNEVLYNVIGIMSVTEDILTAEEHLELGVFNAVTDLAESFPWVFIKETHTNVECSAAPTLNRPIT